MGASHSSRKVRKPRTSAPRPRDEDLRAVRLDNFLLDQAIGESLALQERLEAERRVAAAVQERDRLAEPIEHDHRRRSAPEYDGPPVNDRTATSVKLEHLNEWSQVLPSVDPPAPDIPRPTVRLTQQSSSVEHQDIPVDTIHSVCIPNYKPVDLDQRHPACMLFIDHVFSIQTTQSIDPSPLAFAVMQKSFVVTIRNAVLDNVVPNGLQLLHEYGVVLSNVPLMQITIIEQMLSLLSLYSDTSPIAPALLLSRGSIHTAVIRLRSIASGQGEHVWIVFDAQAGSNQSYYGLSMPLLLFPDEDDVMGYLWRLWQEASPSEDSVQGQIFGVSESRTSWDLAYAEFLEEPPNVQSKVFRCGICLEDEDYSTVICLSCEHEFCCDSLKGFISSRVEEGSLPIPCPSCSVSDPDTRNYITLETARNLDLPEIVTQRWERLEVEAFGVLITCRRCGQSGMIDRSEFLAADQISCPFGGCINRWCRNCEQPVVYGREHTCDGTFELAQAMEENGWKMCPGGCGSRIEKSAGCNHMTCPAPGCFSHFCYRDGSLIIRSEDRKTALEAVRAHYKTCRQFD